MIDFEFIINFFFIFLRNMTEIPKSFFFHSFFFIHSVVRIKLFSLNDCNTI
jgi:hypothetical protein